LTSGFLIFLDKIVAVNTILFYNVIVW